MINNAATFFITGTGGGGGGEINSPMRKEKIIHNLKPEADGNSSF